MQRLKDAVKPLEESIDCGLLQRDNFNRAAKSLCQGLERSVPFCPGLFQRDNFYRPEKDACQGFKRSAP